MFDLTPRRRPDGPAGTAPRSTESIVLRPEVVVDDVDGEEVVNAHTRRHRIAVVAIDIGFRQRRQCLEHLALDQHETGAADLDLERLVCGNRAVSRQMHDVEEAGIAMELVSRDAGLDGFGNAVPVDPLHGARPHDDRLVCCHHADHVPHSDAGVGIDEEQVRRVGLEEMVCDRVAGPLDQALVGEIDRGELVALGLKRERHGRRRPIECRHAGAAVHGRAEGDVQALLLAQSSLLM